MTAPRPGDAFHLDLDGTVITGRYIEVDPPHRLVIGWDRQGTDTATPTPAFIEITFTPTGDFVRVLRHRLFVTATAPSFRRGRCSPILTAHPLRQDSEALTLADGHLSSVRLGF
jgi:uncharacterized protein YndB with AHSA1/START domain